MESSNQQKNKTLLTIAALVASICTLTVAFTLTQAEKKKNVALARPDCLWLCLQQAQEGMSAQAEENLYCDCGSPPPTPIPWKGVAYTRTDAAHIAIIEDELEADWWWDWTHNSAYLSKPLYVATVYCNVSGNLATPAAVEPRDRTWLIFNEPDVPGQCNISPSVAAQRYNSAYDQIKAGSNGEAQILVGGTAFLPTTAITTTEFPRGKPWWEEFLALVKRPIEGIHIHAYPGKSNDGFSFQYPHCEPYYAWGGSPAEALACLTPQLEQTYQFFQNQQKTAGKPIWITETALLGYGHFTRTDMRDDFMIPLVDWFVAAQNGQYPLFQGLSWYSDYDPQAYPDSNLLKSDDSLTLLGEQWKTY